MADQLIENYGIIGNMHTAALVSTGGSIDWFCYPHFDSPSIFGRIIDRKKGGYFKIFPTTPVSKEKQIYWPDTNVLVSRFLTPVGVAEITDYMPVGIEKGKAGYHQLVRKVSVIHGSVNFVLECYPAFNYGRDENQVVIQEKGARFISKDLSFGLSSNILLRNNRNGVVANFTLREGESVSFILHNLKETNNEILTFSDTKAEELLKITISFWQKWLNKCTYEGRWREQVYRSALVLKLLTFNPTGAIIASPTSSLPEGIGGQRNWDYRYTWIRDAAFTVYALMRIGFTEEAGAFIHWVEQRCHEIVEGGELKTMYAIEGNQVPDEEILEHLEGYKGSSPVRIGNGAKNQLQLDIYGEMMDSIYLYDKYGEPIKEGFWEDIVKLIDWVADNWKRKDEGIWEFRGGKQHFVYSKVMCWVALDRAVRLAEKRSFPADIKKWKTERDTIYKEVMEKGFSHNRQAFVSHYGSESLDASTLIMPLVFFSKPTDEKMLKTLKAINRTPERGGLVTNSFVYRYNINESTDGLEGSEGTFNICTFWLVEALTRAGKELGERSYLNEARFIFDQMLGYANHVGLFGEMTGQNGEALGNFPQGFTHLALISAAYNLDVALNHKR